MPRRGHPPEPTLKLVFAGTPEFALPSLEALHTTGHEIAAVYTQPDRPAGRGRKLHWSPIKSYALAHDLPLHQPASLKPAAETEALRALAPELMVVVAYGLLLPQSILDAPRRGCVNVHASLLPRWRGAAPIQRAIEAGDRETGVTIMQMAAGLDTGDILCAAATPIGARETAAGLHDRLAVLGARTLIDCLAKLAAGTLRPQRQDAGLATYAAKLGKDEAWIDWTLPAGQLDRRVRAFNPWPVAATRWRGETLRIWEAEPRAGGGAEPGAVVAAGADGIAVATGDGILVLTRLQLAGGRPLAAGEFVNGHALGAGERLGA
jgi:methionyl-tRNA formyltransferase